MERFGQSVTATHLLLEAALRGESVHCDAGGCNRLQLHPHEESHVQLKATTGLGGGPTAALDVKKVPRCSCKLTRSGGAPAARSSR